MQGADGMAGRRAIIHIGVAKTGSTSIQDMLAQNRRAMLGHGFAYLLSPGDRTQLQLALHVGTRAGAPRGSDFPAALGAEIRALPPSVHTIIFSCEQLSKKVAGLAHAERLKALLDPYFDDYTIIAYLRRQDELGVSSYSTYLRSGGDRDTVLPVRELSLEAYDFEAKLARWATVFGRAAVAPRLFARDALVGGDLLVDFRAACGLPDLPEQTPPLRNASIRPDGQELIRQLNLVRDAADDGDDEKLPNKLRTLINERFSGPGRLPARAGAEAFMARYQDSNERVRAEYFPQRDRLFSDDFSRYPAVADPVPTEASVLRAALTLLLEQDSGERRVEDLYRRGVERLEATKPQEARRHFERALTAVPNHRPALEALVGLADDAASRKTVLRLLLAARAREPDAAEWAAMAERLGTTLPKWGSEPNSSPAARHYARQALRTARREAKDAAAAGAAPPAASTIPQRHERARAERAR